MCFFKSGIKPYQWKIIFRFYRVKKRQNFRSAGSARLNRPGRGGGVGHEVTAGGKGGGEGHERAARDPRDLNHPLCIEREREREREREERASERERERERDREEKKR